MWNTRVNNPGGSASGSGLAVSSVVFRENFVGDGIATTFQLTSGVDNATFGSGSWSAARILNTYPAHVTDENNKPIYLVDGFIIHPNYKSNNVYRCLG